MIPYTEWELKAKLEEIYEGRIVVVPANEDHAKFMIEVAQKYLNDRKKETWNALTKDYSK